MGKARLGHQDPKKRYQERLLTAVGLLDGSLQAVRVLPESLDVNLRESAKGVFPRFEPDVLDRLLQGVYLIVKGKQGLKFSVQYFGTLLKLNMNGLTFVVLPVIIGCCGGRQKRNEVLRQSALILVGTQAR